MPADILRYPVPDIDDLGKACLILDDLKETMFDSGAVGFAANQINEPFNVCVVKISKRKDIVHEFINPSIIRKTGREDSYEGCYSLPGYSAVVPRSESIYVTHLNRDGGTVVSLLTRSEAFIAQHEIDHLQGVLISDYVENANGKSGGTLIRSYDPQSSTVRYLKERAQ